MEARKGILVRDSADHHHQLHMIDQDTDEECGGESSSVDKKKKGAGIRSTRGSGGSVGPTSCQAEKCGADLSEAKKYHRRHKVCEAHSKAAFAVVAGSKQRFCQQCSRFHELSEFDEAKRSCRRRLAGHNERRRKSSVDCGGEASAGKTVISKEAHYNGDGSAKFHATFPGNSHYNKLYHIR